MADVTAKQLSSPGVAGDALAKPPDSGANGQVPAIDARSYALIELLFFAYRDFVSDPDEILTEYGFGRAHHRVIHFVDRYPGIRVTELLDILKITKQSLGRVLKQVIDTGFVEQRPGPQDRRQRLLYVTETGHRLATRLAAPQAARIEAALAALTPGMREAPERFLFAMIDAEERAKVARLHRRAERVIP